MLNIIWMALIVVGVLVAALLGRLSGDDGIVKGLFDSAKAGVVGTLLPLAAVMMVWLGIMRLAERSGIITVLARVIRPLMVRLFPGVPGEHPAMGAIIMNMAANVLGLGNAATPLGLKAMKELETLNPHPGTATNAMCTFLAINTSSVTLIPATAVGLLAAQGMAEPYAIVSTAIGATLCSTIVAIVAVKSFERLPVFRIPEDEGDAAARSTGEREDGAMGEASESDAVGDDEPPGVSSHLKPLTPTRGLLLAGFFAVFAVVLCLEWFPEWRADVQARLGLEDLVSRLGADGQDLDPLEQQPGESIWRDFLMAASVVSIPFVLCFFLVYASLRGVRVYEEFVDGAKEGWGVIITIMPFLVAMLVALSIFRDSGALFVLQEWLRPVLDRVGFPPELVPMALMRPLSGSGSQAVLIETLTQDGITDAVKYMAATMYGSTETTFYVLAVYFGSVAVRRTRHALAAGLCADAAGVVAAVVICRWVFGG